MRFERLVIGWNRQGARLAYGAGWCGWRWGTRSGRTAVARLSNDPREYGEPSFREAPEAALQFPGKTNLPAIGFPGVSEQIVSLDSLVVFMERSILKFFRFVPIIVLIT